MWMHAGLITLYHGVDGGLINPFGLRGCLIPPKYAQSCLKKSQFFFSHIKEMMRRKEQKGNKNTIFKADFTLV